MGARFAPSIVNLNMAKWEEEVLHNSPYQLRLYNRFIDDLIIFWDGKEQELNTLMGMNKNNKNISLSWELSHMKIHFLDLEITNENNKIIMKTHFKAKDRNSYIPQNSCYHKPWLVNVPRGQFLRIKRNCTNISDFEEQSTELDNTFIRKGYD